MFDSPDVCVIKSQCSSNTCHLDADVFGKNASLGSIGNDNYGGPSQLVLARYFHGIKYILLSTRPSDASLSTEHWDGMENMFSKLMT